MLQNRQWKKWNNYDFKSMYLFLASVISYRFHIQFNKQWSDATYCLISTRLTTWFGHSSILEVSTKLFKKTKALKVHYQILKVLKTQL
jgi:ABC-type uncharacterized transport system auxiliary subunit